MKKVAIIANWIVKRLVDNIRQYVYGYLGCKC